MKNDYLIQASSDSLRTLMSFPNFSHDDVRCTRMRDTRLTKLRYHIPYQTVEGVDEKELKRIMKKLPKVDRVEFTSKLLT